MQPQLGPGDDYDTPHIPEAPFDFRAHFTYSTRSLLALPVTGSMVAYDIVRFVSRRFVWSALWRLPVAAWGAALGFMGHTELAEVDRYLQDENLASLEFHPETDLPFPHPPMLNKDYNCARNNMFMGDGLVWVTAGLGLLRATPNAVMWRLPVHTVIGALLVYDYQQLGAVGPYLYACRLEAQRSERREADRLRVRWAKREETQNEM